MNPLHYPDLERCKKLTEIGFPTTELAIHGTGDHFRVLGFVPKDARKYYVKCCPSVMEMLDVIPEFIETYDTSADVKSRNTLKIEVSYRGKYKVSYGEITKKYRTPDTTEGYMIGTLPNALADLIEWLYSNGYIKF